MTILQSSDAFALFFEAVHGVPPFRWQQELAGTVLAEGWPEAIDVPTGLGKTAVVDIAVFCLARQAAEDLTRRTAPTRTFMVVDRRVVVDQTFDRASKVADALRSADASPVVRQAALALGRLAGEEADPLRVVRMRGGVTWAWQWLPRPSQPAVIVTTVDQFGSRLLFRGYGVGERLRPIDAALCGVDSLLILDEAHLSQPFAETATAAADHDARSTDPVLPERRPRPVLLSATLPDGVKAFRPDLGAETSPDARRRLAVARLAHLVEVATRKDPIPDLAEALAALAVQGLEDPGVERVAVVCNTVAQARATFQALPDSLDADLVLLIGRCRQVERDTIAEEWLPRLEARHDRPAAGKVITVATQTIEVGADLDFDHLVTEAAPLDALLQRLGRLDRLGRNGRATAVVVRASRRETDPVYGAATSRTWDWLVEQSEAPPVTRVRQVVDAVAGAPVVDLGPRALGGELLTPGQRRELAAEPPLAPVVLGPVLEAWARTSPVPEPDQPVAPYLHGVERPAAELLVCWRAGLPAPDTGQLQAWEEELRTAPVTADETVAVPLWEARRFLAGPDAPMGPVSDLEGAPEPEDDDEIDLEERTPVQAVVLDPDGTIHPADRDSLPPGGTLVVRSEDGGHDRWGWTGISGTAEGEPVPDVADLVLHKRGRVRLRWRRGPIPVDELPSLRPDDGDDVTGLILGSLQRLAGAGIDAGIGRIVTDLEQSIVNVRQVDLAAELGAGGWQILDLPRSTVPDPATSDDDEASTSGSSEPVSLRQHLWDVAGLARQQARVVGLPDALVRAVELAGRAHDLGKADPRFQAMLHGGDELRALAAPEPLAKSGMDPTDSLAFRQARQRSGWPAGMRHEAISAALVAELQAVHPELFGDVDGELVHHLVQSHHGYARPLLPALLDQEPQLVMAALPAASDPDVRVEVPSDRELVDWGGPSRFSRLGRRYGQWGLALLEAIVRMADMEASASYQRGGSR